MQNFEKRLERGRLIVPPPSDVEFQRGQFGSQGPKLYVNGK